MDLRSDTTTRPSEAMREFILSAPVGDHGYGEDPTQRSLERQVARLMGHEAALFVVSGTAANILATLSHAEAKGGTIIGAENSHVFENELQGYSVLGRCQKIAIPTPSGIFDEADIERALTPNDLCPGGVILWVENSFTHSGGQVWPMKALRRVVDKAAQLGWSKHLDGARLWNAATSIGVDVADIGGLFDSVSLCFSKGLGAPIGSCLVGSESFIDRARIYSKMIGGVMRQSGIAAAGALFAVNNHREGIVADHRKALLFCDGLRQIAPVRVLNSVETNIVLFDVPGIDGSYLERSLEEAEISVRRLGETVFRAVFHRDISELDLERALVELRRITEMNLVEK